MIIKRHVDLQKSDFGLIVRSGVIAIEAVVLGPRVSAIHRGCNRQASWAASLKYRVSVTKRLGRHMMV